MGTVPIFCYAPDRTMPAPISRRRFLTLASTAALGGWTWAEPPRVEVEVLGVAQDAGMPHFACDEHACGRARQNPALRRRVASLGIRAGSRLFLIDATPDINSQVAALQRGAARPRIAPVDGVLLTHAHIGHYLGLAFFGKESVASDHVPVYVTARMAEYLAANGPWSLLVSDGHIDSIRITPGRPFPLALGLNVEAFAVPHREEFTDTVGYLLSGPTKSLIYIPDIDRWEGLAPSVESLAQRADVLLLDGSFFDPATELPGRDPRRIPHPPIPQTMRRLAHLASSRDIRFLHLNHTNPVWDPDSVEHRKVLGGGFQIASEGDRFSL